LFSHGILKTWQHDPPQENLILVAYYYKNQLVVVMVVVGTHTYREKHTQTFVGRACAKELLHMLYIPLKEEGALPAASAPFMWHNT
jgi:hypothetical protein